jgi:hypothetical protein
VLLVPLALPLPLPLRTVLLLLSQASRLVLGLQEPVLQELDLLLELSKELVLRALALPPALSKVSFLRLARLARLVLDSLLLVLLLETVLLATLVLTLVLPLTPVPLVPTVLKVPTVRTALLALQTVQTVPTVPLATERPQAARASLLPTPILLSPTPKRRTRLLWRLVNRHMRLHSAGYEGKSGSCCGTIPQMQAFGLAM